jgi:DNA invertase Pin-like site-specific DNA recombinase
MSGSGVAAYARYSSDDQRATSIDDQLRRCHQVAQRHGLTIDERLVFADEAVTGKAEGRSRRSGYQRLLDAIEAGEVTCVVTDEISRLTRHMREGALLIDLVEQRGLRVYTADGIDTTRDDWKMLVMLKLMTAVHEVDSTSARTTRGMLGALHRGFMIAPPPYGYRLVRDRHARRGSPEGARWVVDEEQAAVVRRVYRARHAGMSLAQIAAMLMRDGVAPPLGRDGRPSYWRPGRIASMLGNPIYRGVFVWNGSPYTRSRARKRNRQVVTQEFPRPELRLVSDELWYACCPGGDDGAGSRQRAPRGGGRHLFAGLVTCGDCASLLSVSGGPASFGLHCPSCETAVRVGAREGWIGYSSVQAARLALGWGLEQLFGAQVIAEFRQRLAQRFEDGPQREERELRSRVQRLEATLERLKQLALNPAVGPELFQDELAQTASQLRVARTRLEALTRGEGRLTEQQLRAQLELDPLPLLHQMLDGGVEVYAARATLRRLLERFALVARPASGVSVYRIAFRPGVCVAELAQCAVIDPTVHEYEVVVTCSKARPTRWSVSGHAVAAEAESPTEAAVTV